MTRRSTGAPDDFIAQLLFGIFDDNGDGIVDFQEVSYRFPRPSSFSPFFQQLLTLLSVAIHGSQEEKMDRMLHDDGW